MIPLPKLQVQLLQIVQQLTPLEQLLLLNKRSLAKASFILEFPIITHKILSNHLPDLFVNVKIIHATNVTKAENIIGKLIFIDVIKAAMIGGIDCAIA